MFTDTLPSVFYYKTQPKKQKTARTPPTSANIFLFYMLKNKMYNINIYTICKNQPGQPQHQQPQHHQHLQPLKKDIKNRQNTASIGNCSKCFLYYYIVKIYLFFGNPARTTKKPPERPPVSIPANTKSFFLYSKNKKSI